MRSEDSLTTVMTPASPGLFRMDETGQGLITIASTDEIAMPTTKGVQSRPAAQG